MAADEARRAVEKRLRRRAHRTSVAPRAQIGRQLRDGAVALARRLRERFRDDGVEIAAEERALFVRGHRAHQRRVDVADRPQRVERRELLEHVGRASREQLIEHDAERIHVARGRHAIAAHLLGARVFGREAVLPGARRAGALFAFRHQHRRDPEVEQLRLTLGGDEDVGRLHVAMDHQMLMRVGQGVADALDERHALAQAQAARSRTSRRCAGRPRIP